MQASFEILKYLKWEGLGSCALELSYSRVLRKVSSTQKTPLCPLNSKVVFQGWGGEVMLHNTIFLKWVNSGKIWLEDMIFLLSYISVFSWKTSTLKALKFASHSWLLSGCIFSSVKARSLEELCTSKNLRQKLIPACHFSTCIFRNPYIHRTYTHTQSKEFSGCYKR